MRHAPVALALLLCCCGRDRTWLYAAGAGQAAARDAREPSARDADESATRDTALDNAVDRGLGLSGAMPLQDWPLISIGVESRQFSSFDRSGGNDDGFSGRYSALYEEAGEYVIFDALGPGRLNTLWFTSGAGGSSPLSRGQVRFYFDDELTPRADVDADRLFSGAEPGFSSNLVFDNRRSTGGFVSFVPMTFERRLKISTGAKPFFYNAQYDTFPVDTPLSSWNAAADVSSLEQPFGALLAGAEPMPTSEGEEVAVPLEYTYTGAGTIDGLRIRLAPESVAALHEARIEISWDEQAAPAVDCPLDMFFGSGLGLAPVHALGFSIWTETAELVSRFPMPFWRGFHLRISGVQGELSLRIGPERYPEQRSGYFHARFAHESPPAAGQDFQYLAERGAGKLVGTVLTVKPFDPSKHKGWWEGDLRSYVNERRTPSIHGTGHEDDHLGGWSNDFFSGPFTLPMSGEPAAEILDLTGQFNGNVSMYRLWPGISFAREVRHSVEHGRANDRDADYSSTSFFYGNGADGLSDSDRLIVCDADSRRAHAFVAEGESAALEVDSSFEGRAYREGFQACHQAHTGSAQFQLEISPDNRGVYLRRLYDQSTARQRAQVSVDGRVVGDWYIVEGNGASAWAERDYFLPSGFTRGKAHLSIQIAPLAGSPPWDAAEYRSLSVATR